MNPKQLKFFIVDDDLFCSNAYEQYLKNLSYTDVIYFSNGDECLNNLHLKPDIIFLDHGMNDMNGFETLKKIKRYNPNIYVIMVSGQKEINIAVEALKYGAFGYLAKDTTVCEKMREIINRIIRIQEEIDKGSRNNEFYRLFSFFF
ncbi:MAG: response regulator [Chryseobacterium sp.]|uniref:response regulator n=1 Tax=Chryseobacterium sp. TaxID=1871047 RepID=UPI0025C3CAE9|nr:response regulator [Chryseobacterium sp.]MCJ7936266.1 response regulator [Chryseobacterium sp.]